MTLKLRYFTVEEANLLLPKIIEILTAARETKLRIEEKVNSWRQVHKSITEAEEAVLRGQVDFLATHLETQLGEITDLGAVPKDLDMGLVDFPARVESKEGYLCWKMGETTVQYWHGLTEGFQGRRSLEENKKHG